MNNYLSFSAQLERLLNEYDTYGRLIIAVDHDNTVFDYGMDLKPIQNLVKKAHDLDFEVYVFTANNNLQSVRDFWDSEMGIPNVPLNSSPSVDFGTRKPFYSLLLDDRAGLRETFHLLTEVVKYAENKLAKEL